MASFTYDLRFARAGLEVLENFLLAGDIYWPIGIKAAKGETPYPQLSLGNLLLALERGQSSATSPKDRNEISQLKQEIEAIFQRWPVAVQNKAGRELSARLTQWRNFIEEYREYPEANFDRYPYEIFRRVVISLLLPIAPSLGNAEQDLLNGLDGLLKSLLQAGDFIWDKVLQVSFPEASFWYLYGRLPKNPRQ